MDIEKIKILVASIRIRRSFKHIIIKGTTRKKWYFFGKSEKIELHIYCTKKNTVVYIDKEGIAPFTIGDKLCVVESWAKKERLNLIIEQNN